MLIFTLDKLSNKDKNNPKYQVVFGGVMGFLDERPDAEKIAQLDQHLGSLWANAHDKYALYDSYYDRTFPIWDTAALNRQRSSYRPSRARNLVDHAADTQMAYEPKVKRRALGETQQQEDNANACERFVKAILEDSSLMEPDLPAKRGAKNLLLYGYTVFEAPTMNFERYPKKPKPKDSESGESYDERMEQYERSKANWNPFRIQSYNPARVLLDPLEKQPCFAIKRTSHLSYKLNELTKTKSKTRRNVKIWEVGDNPFELIETRELWTDAYHALSIKDGDLLYTERNTWGFVPFTHAFAGFGFEPTNMQELDPQYLGSGILEGVLDSLKLQAQELTGRHNALMRAAFNKMGTRKDPEEAASELEGDLLQGDPGDFWWLQMQELPRYFENQEAFLDRDIEMGTYSMSLAGVRQPGVTTVGQQAILSTAANRKFAGPARQLDYMFSIIASNILRLVDKNGETLTVRGETLNPKQIEGNYTIEVSFELIDPVLHLQEKQFALQEYQSGLRSRESYWEVARVEDSTTERDRLMDDLLTNDPRVKELMIKEIAKGRRMQEMLDAAEAPQRQNGASPMPARPMPASPLAAPMGEPTASPPQPGDPFVAAQELRQPLTPQVAKPGANIPYDIA